jgi:hypothetical protein
MKKGILIIALSFIMLLPTMALATPLPDTGQTKCYDNSQEITCPNPGEAFYGQDAQYPCNPQSYTKLDEDGNDLSDEATKWVMVRDNVTGLIWENKTNDGHIHDKDNSYTWYQAQDGFIAALNSAHFGGFSDWRLPTVMELSFLVDKGRDYPLINSPYFPDMVLDFCYWSSTTNALYPLYAWYVYFGGSMMSFCVDKSSNLYVRAVRGQCGGFDNFIDNGDGTVTNTDTGLMWQQDTAPVYTWQEALSYCENLTLADYTDWRLPNINELQSLVDYTRYAPSIDTVYFPNTWSSYYWSSTTDANGPYVAWYVHFSPGYVAEYYKSTYGGGVRAVRGPVAITTTTTPQPCASELIYGAHSEQTELLRYFRDNVLTQTPEGQEIIRLYYELSPMIVQMMNEDEEFREEAKEMIDGVLPLIRGIVE